MIEMEASRTEEIIFMVRDTSWDDQPTQPPHPRSERTIEALWRELEEARNADWIRCLALAVASANEKGRGR